MTDEVTEMESELNAQCSWLKAKEAASFNEYMDKARAVHAMYLIDHKSEILADYKMLCEKYGGTYREDVDLDDVRNVADYEKFTGAGLSNAQMHSVVESAERLGLKMFA
jgi:hypothetical protein